MPVIKNTLNGSLIIHLDSGRMVFLEALAKLELQPEDMSSPALVKFLEEGKVLIVDDDAPQINPYDVNIRPASPNRADGEIYAQHLNLLSPGFKKVYGEEADDVIISAFTRPGHILSFEHVEFAEKDGEILGTLACFTQEHHAASVSGGLRQALRSFPGFRFGSAFLVRFLKHFGPETAGDYYIWALFVEDRLRGQGLGTQLLYRAEMRAKEFGYGRLVLDVEAQNKGAIRLYERQGMTLGAGWPKLPFVSPGAFRMFKVL